MMLRGFVVSVALGAAMFLPSSAAGHPATAGGAFGSSGMWSLLCGGRGSDDCELTGAERARASA